MLPPGPVVPYSPRPPAVDGSGDLVGEEKEDGAEEFEEAAPAAEDPAQEVAAEKGLRPKLAEGFYEIEAIRRRRRKGFVLFLAFGLHVRCGFGVQLCIS